MTLYLFIYYISHLPPSETDMMSFFNAQQSQVT